MSTMDGKNHSFQLMEPDTPETLMPDAGISLWWAVAGGSVLLGIIILWIVLKRRSVANHPLTLRNAAHAEAASSLSNLTVADVRGAAIQCSLILRRYLSVATGDPALFETHEEFISRNDALQNLSASARSSAESGFIRLAGLKYAPDLPPAEVVDIITESRALLETLHHGFTT